MELLKHYKNFIESDPQNKVDDNGHVMRETSEGFKPVMKEGKEVVLPTPEFLKNPDWNRYMAFHPMCESIARGESDILQLAQLMVRLNLWDKYIDVGQKLLQIAADASLQTKLTPSQQKLLTAISDADATTYENFNKIVARSKHDYTDGVDRRLIAIYLKRGGSQDGQHYSRMFVVRFPMYAELCKAEEAKDAKERKVFDVQLRAKDIPVLKALHETIFPGDESAYTIGTNSNLAPYYTVLLNGYANMARQLNSVIKPFSKSHGIKQIDLSWDEGDNLSVYRNAIPPLPHNEGADPTAEPAPAQQPVVQQPAMVQQQPAPVYAQPAMQPQAQPQPQQPTTPAPTMGSQDPKHAKSNTVSWNDLNKQNAQVSPYGFPQQVQYGQPPMMPQPGYGQPQMMMQPQPMMPQQMYQQPMMPQQPMPYGQQVSYQPMMANGQPQPPMPPTSQPQMPQGQVPYMPQPQMMPQQMYQQPMMPQPGYGQPQMPYGQQQPMATPFTFVR
jgi:hypothetical protein